LKTRINNKAIGTLINERQSKRVVHKHSNKILYSCAYTRRFVTNWQTDRLIDLPTHPIRTSEREKASKRASERWEYETVVSYSSKYCLKGREVEKVGGGIM